MFSSCKPCVPATTAELAMDMAGLHEPSLTRLTDRAPVIHAQRAAARVPCILRPLPILIAAQGIGSLKCCVLAPTEPEDALEQAAIMPPCLKMFYSEHMRFL